MNESIKKEQAEEAIEPKLTKKEIKEKFGYDAAEDFAEGYATVYDDKGNMFHIKGDGAPAYESRFDTTENFHGGLARTRTRINKDLLDSNGEYFHIKADGKPAYEERYDWILNFSEGLAGVEQDGKMFHILPDGKPAYKERFDEVGDFVDGLALVAKNGEYFYINPDGTKSPKEFIAEKRPE